MAAQNQQTAALAKQGAKKDVQSLLKSDQFKQAVAMVLPKTLKPERFIRVALTAILRTPKLADCTQESLFRCLLDLSMLGLEPDGRRAHLIPFNNKVKGKDGREHWEMQCQLIVDYKGIAELVRRSGDVSYIHSDVICEHDDFDYSYGSGAFLKHKPGLDDRGQVRGAYSFVKLKDGTEDFIVLSRSEVEAVRKRSRSATSGPWVTDWNEMAKKTAFRRHSKWLPLSPETREAVEKDDDAAGVDIPRELPEAVSLSIDMFHPSSDENRGHDATEPQGKESGPEAAGEPEGPEETAQGESALFTEEAVPHFSSWDDVRTKAGDEYAPSLGLHIKVGKSEFARNDPSESFTKKGK